MGFLKSNLRVVFFGDSICAGQAHRVHDSWVGQVSQALENECGEKPFIVSNVSISGDTTRMALGRMKFDLRGTDGADVFYTQFGLNDANHWADENGIPRVTQKSFKANLLEICERANAAGTRKLFIGTNHPVPAKPAEKWSANVDPYPKWVSLYNNVIREVAQETEAYLVDHEQFWKSKSFSLSDYLLEDGIHLSKIGHDAYFELAGPLIVKAALAMSPLES